MSCEQFLFFLGFFSEHASAWALVLVTVFSVAVSAVIAGVAIWTGRQARETSEVATRIAADSTRIAKESLTVAKDASDREEKYREDERRRQRDESRHSASVAMSRSFWALEAAIADSKMVPDSPQSVKSADRANSHKVEAATEIELLHPDEKPELLMLWFEETWKRMRSLQGDDALRDNYRGEAVGSVRRWRNRITLVEDFLDPQRQL